MLQKTLGGIFHEKAIYNHCFNRYFNYNRYLCTIKYSNRSSQPFWAQVKMPLVLLIFICLLIGAIIIYLLSFSNHLKTNNQLKELQSSRVSKDEFKKYQKKIDQLQKENAQLKQQLKNQTVAEKAQDSSAK